MSEEGEEEGRRGKGSMRIPAQLRKLSWKPRLALTSGSRRTSIRSATPRRLRPEEWREMSLPTR